MDLDRRSFLKLGALGVLGAAVTPSLAFTPLHPYQSTPRRYAFGIGALKGLAVNDGDVAYKASAFFSNAPTDQLDEVLAARRLQPDSIPSPFTCLFVATEKHKVLVDTGAGSLADSTGHLLAQLIAEGIHPDEIDTVILTHAHPDHIGGHVGPDGELLFPNAEFVMDEVEWAFWTDEQRLATTGTFFAAVARRALTPLVDRMRVIRGETEIVPGIRSVPAAGHTPGHTVLVVESGGDQLLYLSDTVLHPIHLEQPGWRTTYDMDAPASDVSKRRVADMAAADHMHVLGFHFDPFPSLGEIVRTGNAWRWVADTAD